MTKTQEEIEAQVTADADKFDLSRVQPTEVEIHKNACNYAEKQLLDLVHSPSTDRAFHHFNKNWPHEYVSDIMGKLNEIRADIRARQGTPGFGKLKGVMK